MVQDFPHLHFIFLFLQELGCYFCFYLKLKSVLSFENSRIFSASRCIDLPTSTSRKNMYLHAVPSSGTRPTI